MGKLVRCRLSPAGLGRVGEGSAGGIGRLFCGWGMGGFRGGLV
jgi:hypothetical protein